MTGVGCTLTCASWVKPGSGDCCTAAPARQCRAVLRLVMLKLREDLSCWCNAVQPGSAYRPVGVVAVQH